MAIIHRALGFFQIAAWLIAIFRKSFLIYPLQRQASDRAVPQSFLSSSLKVPALSLSVNPANLRNNVPAATTGRLLSAFKGYADRLELHVSRMTGTTCSDSRLQFVDPVSAREAFVKPIPKFRPAVHVPSRMNATASPNATKAYVDPSVPIANPSFRLTGVNQVRKFGWE